MIELGSGPELPEEDEAKDKKRKKRGFLSSWLEAREVNPADEAEESVERKDKGLSALWKRLFERNVSMEPVDEPQEEESKAVVDSVLEWWPRIEQPRDDPDHEEIPELTLPMVDEADPARPRVAEDIAEPAEESPVFESVDFPMPAEDKIPEQIHALHEASADFSGAGPEANPAKIIETREPRPETKVDRREPLAAVTLLGLGAEYIGRKRQGAAHEKRLEGLERKSKGQLAKVERLEAELPKRGDRTESFKSREARPVARQAEARQELNTSEAREIAKERPRGSEKLAEQVAKRVERYEKQHNAPTAVLKEMVRAAEVDAPVERIYERRQEVRDEPGAVSSSAVPISAVIRNMAPPSHPPSLHSPESGWYASPKSRPSNPDLYRQAAQRGFWGAVVIVIFMLMVYLLT